MEPADDVRSVPLGAKRRKGRPKNLPNCLANSPIHERLPSSSPAAVVDDEAPLRKTKRKRKRMEVKPDADHVVHPSDLLRIGLRQVQESTATQRKAHA